MTTATEQECRPASIGLVDKAVHLLLDVCARQKARIDVLEGRLDALDGGAKAWTDGERYALGAEARHAGARWRSKCHHNTATPGYSSEFWERLDSSIEADVMRTAREALANR